MRNLNTPSKPRLFLVAAALAALTLSGLAQERDRSKIADKYNYLRKGRWHRLSVTVSV